jgi:SRSO17 transposase
VPENVRFATKGRLARVMLERAFEAEIPARWVLADSIYGADSKLRNWLEERGKHYVLGVHRTTRVWHAPGDITRCRHWRRDYRKPIGGGFPPGRAARANVSTIGLASNCKTNSRIQEPGGGSSSGAT